MSSTPTRHYGSGPRVSQGARERGRGRSWDKVCVYNLYVCVIWPSSPTVPAGVGERERRREEGKESLSEPPPELHSLSEGDLGNQRRWSQEEREEAEDSILQQGTVHAGKVSQFVCQRVGFAADSCQFVVADRGDYAIHTSDPDLLVNWDTIELVVSPSLSLSLVLLSLLVPTASLLPRDPFLSHLSLPSHSWYETL